MIIDLHKDRAKTLKELADSIGYYFTDITYDEQAKKMFLTAEIKPALQELHQRLDSVDFNHDNIKAVFNDVMQKYNLNMKSIAQPIRVALTGNTMSPSIFEVVLVMSKEIVLARLIDAIKAI